MSRTPTERQPKLFPAEQYARARCRDGPDLRLDRAEFESRLDDADGNTNQAIGLAWAWQSLTEEPFTIPTKEPNYRIRSHHSDERRAEYGEPLDDQPSIDTRQADDVRQRQSRGHYALHDPCEHRRRSDFDRAAELRDGTDKFFTVTSSGQINTVFSQIGTNLSKLRIAK